MIPGGGDLSGLLAQAQAMQAQLAQAQQELADATVEGSAGGGLVKATVTGNGELVGLEIAAEACDPDDTESLADLVVAAVRDATSKSQEIAAQKMPQLPEGMGLPEGLGGGLPF